MSAVALMGLSDLEELWVLHGDFAHRWLAEDMRLAYPDASVQSSHSCVFDHERSGLSLTLHVDQDGIAASICLGPEGVEGPVDVTSPFVQTPQAAMGSLARDLDRIAALLTARSNAIRDLLSGPAATLSRAGEQ